MNALRIETDYDGYYPGTEARVRVMWEFGPEVTLPQRIEIRLAWSTAGKGDRDYVIARRVDFESSTAQGEHEVTIKLPWGPYSFSGKLISLMWAIEVALSPQLVSARKEIVIGPNSQEVLIGAARKTSGEILPGEGSAELE